MVETLPSQRTGGSASCDVVPSDVSPSWHSYFDSGVRHASVAVSAVRDSVASGISATSTAYKAYKAVIQESSADRPAPKRICTFRKFFDIGPTRMGLLSGGMDGWRLDLVRVGHQEGDDQLMQPTVVYAGAEKSPVYTATLVCGDPSRIVVACVLYEPSNESGLSVPGREVHMYEFPAKQPQSIPFSDEIHGLEASRSAIAVLFLDKIAILDPKSFVLQTEIDGVAGRLRCFALGDRWLAYPSATALKQPSCNNQSCDCESCSRAAKTEIVTEVAKGISKGIKLLGNTAAWTYAYLVQDKNEDIDKTGNNNASENQSTTVSPIRPAADNPEGLVPSFELDSSEELEYAHGSVIIVDVKTCKQVASVRTDDGPLSVLQFDSTGTLLTTSATHGRHINIYIVSAHSRAPNQPMSDMKWTKKERTCQFLYRLVRGMTSARVLSVSLSRDSRWVAALTERGTVHLFAVNPMGGPVAMETHARYHSRSGVQLPIRAYPFQPWQGNGLICGVLARIHAPSGSWAQWLSAEQVPPRRSCDVRISNFDSHSGEFHVFVALSDGHLMIHTAVPYVHGVADGSAPETLELNVSQRQRLRVDLDHFPEFDSKKAVKVLQHEALSKEKNPPSWLSDLETTTCAPPPLPLWKCPQFRFMAFEESACESVSASVDVRYGIQKDTAKYMFVEELGYGLMDRICFETDKGQDGFEIPQPSAPPASGIKSEIFEALKTPLSLVTDEGSPTYT
eukprot:Rmarinus@m.14694